MLVKGGGRDFHRYTFRRRDALAWLDGLLGRAEHVPSVPAEAIRLTDYSASEGIPTMEMIARLRAGALTIVSQVHEGRTFADTFAIEPADPDADGIVAAKVAVYVLGLPAAEIQAIADAGLLERRKASACRQRADRTFFSRRSLDDLCGIVRSKATLFDAGADERKRSDFRPAKAVRRFGGAVTWPVVLSAVRDGSLPVLLDPQRSPTLTGSLFLKDASDLEHLAIAENLTSRMLSMSEAAKFLGTDTGAVSAFRAAGLLGQGGRHLGVTLGNLEAFRERYVLSAEIVGRRDIGWFELTRTLEAAGIEPASEWFSEDGKPVRRIYDRRQVEALIGLPSIRR